MLVRRLAALAALVMLLVAIVIGLVALGGDVLRTLAVLLLLPVTAAGAWYAATRRGFLRTFGFLVAGLGLVGVIVLTITAGREVAHSRDRHLSVACFGFTVRGSPGGAHVATGRLVRGVAVTGGRRSCL
jgi:hypothetical protein